MSRKKDVAGARAAGRVRKTKSADLAPKKTPDMLPGHVEARMVKCGKQGCKCSRGELHGPYFYHRTWGYNTRSKSYVRLSGVPQTLAACEAYRHLQAELREGRATFRHLMSRLRSFTR